MADLRLVTYCGLYCGLYSQKCRIPEKAQALLDTMRIEGYEHCGQEIPGYKNLWSS